MLDNTTICKSNKEVFGSTKLYYYITYENGFINN